MIGYRILIVSAAFAVMMASGPRAVSGPSEDEQTRQLHAAIGSADLERVRNLIAEGADVDRASAEGLTPLVLAVESGDPDVVRLLLASGADPDWGAFRFDLENDMKPIHAAVRSGRVELVRILLDAGADVNAVHGDEAPGAQYTALSHAILAGKAKMVEELIGRGADTDGHHCPGYDCTKLTYVELAAAIGNVELVRIFIDAGNVVDPPREDLMTRQGLVVLTPLMWAATYGHSNVVTVLLDEYGVTVSTKDAYDCMALDFAIAGEHEEVIGILRATGGATDQADCRRYR